jgi:hypothetical protein
MTDDNQTPAEVDPFEHAANELLYGDPTSAAKVLRDAVMHGAAQAQANQARQGVLRREVAASA